MSKNAFSPIIAGVMTLPMVITEYTVPPPGVVTHVYIIFCHGIYHLGVMYIDHTIYRVGVHFVGCVIVSDGFKHVLITYFIYSSG